MFLAGLIIGTTLLLVGLGLGIWIGRRMAPPQILDDSMERAQVLRFVRNFASITSDFAGDFSAYQAEFESLAKRASETGKKPTADEVTQSLSSFYKAVDKAAKTNVIHKNAAARYKSRLTKLVNSKLTAV
jgi:small subunit ribosomal protein S20